MAVCWTAAMPVGFRLGFSLAPFVLMPMAVAFVLVPVAVALRCSLSYGPERGAGIGRDTNVASAFTCFHWRAPIHGCTVCVLPPV